ncbi:MAG: efflux RND transporter permease subunit, partial [bacterium]|nr:efflux RND transporter permease subunit [bacterium]
MKFTDIFIKRPVLATVISLIILLLGIQGFFSVPVREFPLMENTVINVTTAYPGAPQDLIQGFITTPIQTAMASAEGIDYMTSTSTPGQSQIQAYIELNYDPNAALAEIMSKVAQVQNQLPKEAQQPVIQKQTGSNIKIFYMGFYSDTMTAEQITEYLIRVVQPLFETVPGVGEVDILGQLKYSMRIWLDPQAMAARQVTPDEVFQALQNNNYQAGAGQIKGYFTVTSINAETTLHDVDQFKQLVVKQNNGTLIRIGDIARVELGAQSYDSLVWVKGKPAVAVSVNETPDANPLTVIKSIKEMLPEMQKQMPTGLEYDVLLDQTVFIQESIDEVNFTIWLTAAIVIGVIFVFMGNFRAVAIPVITIPLSLVGVIFFMQAMSFSLNLLTLLAMVLAIGLVVDDAIVVVENVQRHIDQGKTPIEAAKIGAREIAAPIIVMTITLATVYAPIGFIGGLSGALFREFAFTLAGAVVVSGIIALTLSPMMSSRFLKGGAKPKMELFVEKAFGKVRGFYERALDDVLEHRPMIVLMAVVVLASIPFLFLFTPSELAPQEDKGIIMATGTGPMYSNLDYTSKYTDEAAQYFNELPENEIYFSVAGFTGVNTAFVATSLKPWKKRKRSQRKIQMALQEQLRNIPGMEFYTFVLPPLPSSTSGLPLQFVITTQGSGYEILYDVMKKIEEASYKEGIAIFIDNSLRMDKPQIELSVDTSKAGQLGISMAEVGKALALAFGDNYINYFDMQG